MASFKFTPSKLIRSTRNLNNRHVDGGWVARSAYWGKLRNEFESRFEGSRAATALAHGVFVLVLYAESYGAWEFRYGVANTVDAPIWQFVTELLEGTGQCVGPGGAMQQKGFASFVFDTFVSYIIFTKFNLTYIDNLHTGTFLIYTIIVLYALGH